MTQNKIVLIEILVVSLRLKTDSGLKEGNLTQIRVEFLKNSVVWTLLELGTDIQTFS